jgi:SAM-dependent methyltransferase
MSNYKSLFFHEALLQQAFQDEKGVLLRKQLHEEYSVPSIDLPHWVLNRVEWRGDEQVLDIGSGPGTYVDELLTHIALDHYIGGDVSHGMIQAVRQRYSGLKAGLMDAQALPFADESFDIILANQVLAYVPDIELALSEIRRVLRRPKGMLVATISSEFTMPEFNTLMQRAVRLLRRGTGEELNDNAIEYHFSLEQGAALLSNYFPAVARYDLPSKFIFRDAQPVTDYIESCRPFFEPKLPPTVHWDEFMTIMADQVRRLVDHFGELEVNKLTGVIIATEAGGFAEAYHQRLKATP